MSLFDTAWLHTHPDVGVHGGAWLRTLHDAGMVTWLVQGLLNESAGEEVTSRSSNNNAGAILRNMGSNPGGDGLHGSSVAWAWMQDNFAGSIAAQ